MIYVGVSVGILNSVIASLPFAFTLIFGINDDYNPGWGFGDIIWYIIPIVVCAIIGLMIELKIPVPKEEGGFGKDVKFALMYSMLTEGIGFLIAFFGVYSSRNLNPDTFVVPE